MIFSEISPKISVFSKTINFELLIRFLKTLFYVLFATHAMYHVAKNPEKKFRKKLHLTDCYDQLCAFDSEGLNTFRRPDLSVISPKYDFIQRWSRASHQPCSALDV